ncbi:CoA ester lyase [Psychrobacillus sp. FJAT-51614]|uniref:CoA ester lyase n=1 Tax=Psychrobacillus mangrovi TaxID=3117745 RepID=A0ABU8F1S6_9BACI
MNLARSYLFVPGTNMDIIKKAVLSNADSVILDLEDAVALSEKESAREIVKESLIRFGNEKEMIVRINDLDTPFWEMDLKCALSSGASGVMVPKSESFHGIRSVCNKVREFSSNHSRPIQVIPLIETAKGIQFAHSIATSDKLIARMAFGSIDFSLDIDCELTPNGLELLFARSQIVIASRAAGIGSPIDTVYPELNNETGLENDAKLAKQLGFKGKLIIHPKQIQAVHQTFSPSKTEIDQATAIVKAFEEAENNGIASIEVNDQFVDYPVYKKAKSILFHTNS